MTLDKNGYLDIDWPTRRSMTLYKAILDAGKTFRGLGQRQKVYSSAQLVVAASE